MPKRVDHEARRAEIAEATWRLMAERGIDAVTMREISAALGVANGALKHYFPGKNAIIESAFLHVFDATNARIAERVGGRTGLAALREFCLEVLPRDELTTLEARVVLPFWQRALTDAGLAGVLTASMDQWRRQIAGFLRQGRESGEVTAEFPDEVLAEQLLAMLNGAQIACLDPAATPPEVQVRMLDAFLAGLAPAGRPAAHRPAEPGFLSFADTALDHAAERLPGTDRAAMAMVLLVHRVASSLVYDLESTVHRPAGWSWSAFRLLFTLWVAGAQEVGRVAELCGMSRAAVSGLAKTLEAAGLVERGSGVRDRRSVVLGLTGEGAERLEAAFREHNARESEWARLLPPGELVRLNALLAELARAAHQAPWIKRRS